MTHCVPLSHFGLRPGCSNHMHCSWCKTSLSQRAAAIPHALKNNFSGPEKFLPALFDAEWMSTETGDETDEGLNQICRFNEVT